MWDPNDPNPPSNPEAKYILATIYRIRIIDVFKGDVQIDDIAEVFQLGGELGNDLWTSEHKISITPGKDLVLFLFAPLGIDLHPASLLNPSQSVYHFPAQGEVGLLGVNDELESVDDRNDLTLTFGDLLRIQEENSR